MGKTHGLLNNKAGGAYTKHCTLKSSQQWSGPSFASFTSELVTSLHINYYTTLKCEEEQTGIPIQPNVAADFCVTWNIWPFIISVNI
jgi:hypothetical protein